MERGKREDEAVRREGRFLPRERAQSERVRDIGGHVSGRKRGISSIVSQGSPSAHFHQRPRMEWRIGYRSRLHRRSRLRKRAMFSVIRYSEMTEVLPVLTKARRPNS